MIGQSIADDQAPREFAALRARILERARDLPRRLTQVAAYALDNPDEIAFGTAAGIAERAGVQPSTLVRFSQALGYQGFSDLQDVFRSRLRDRVPSYAERLDLLREHGLDASKARALLDGFSEAASRSVADFQARASTAAMERAVDILAGAATVYLVGLRRSFPVTSYMSYAMAKLGIRSVLVDAIAGLGAEQAAFIGPEDAMLSISFTPYASEAVDLTTGARARGAKIVAITDSALSPLALPADVCLEVAEANFEGFRSMAATMALAMTLIVAVAGRRREAD